jgi:hypothetical protein
LDINDFLARRNRVCGVGEADLLEIGFFAVYLAAGEDCAMKGVASTLVLNDATTTVVRCIVTGDEESITSAIRNRAATIRAKGTSPFKSFLGKTDQ